MAERLIEVRDLSKAYGGQPVIEGLSLVLEPGAIVGLIGPSGGGKTTTLRMFAGLLRPDAGGGHVLGEDVHLPEPRRRRRIGYMGQRLALYPDLTVLENFSAQAEMFAVPAAHRAIAAVTERYDLRPLLARRFGALSAGEARRVQFAATVLHAPPLLLLDEPTIGFDAETGHDIWRWLATLAAEGHGVVVSTNNPSEAERCDTVVLHRDRRALPQQSPGGLPAAFGGEGFGAVFGRSFARTVTFRVAGAKPVASGATVAPPGTRSPSRMIRSILPVALAAIVIAAPASAAEVKKFSPAEFAAAQAAGKSILIDVKAPWCPVCASQHNTIQSAVTAAKFNKLTILEIDYDTQKDAWRGLGVKKQGTLIAYKGKQEVGRVEFKTDKMVINDLLASAVN